MLTGHANYLSARRNLGSIGVDRETNHEHTRHSGYGATVFVASATCSPPTDSGSRVLFAETKPVDRTSIVSGFDANISDTDVAVFPKMQRVDQPYPPLTARNVGIADDDSVPGLEIPLLGVPLLHCDERRDIVLHPRLPKQIRKTLNISVTLRR